MRTPAIGGEARRLSAILMALAVMAALFVVFANPASATRNTTSTSVDNTSTSSNATTTTSGQTTSTDGGTTTTGGGGTTTTGGDTTTTGGATTSTGGDTSTSEDVSGTTVPPNTWVCDEETGVPVEIGPDDPRYPGAPNKEEAAENCEVAGTVITTAPEVDPGDELPFTGLDANAIAGATVVLMGLGASLLAITRRPTED